VRGGDDRELVINTAKDQPRQHAFLKQAFVVLMNSELNNIDDN
jgi:hypothetical protein